MGPVVEEGGGSGEKELKRRRNDGVCVKAGCCE